MRIGALPSLATGAYARARTQAWARAIYEDQPARRAVRGIYYHAAHSNGRAMALWNTDADVDCVRASSGETQDFALADARVWPSVVVAAAGLVCRVRNSLHNCNRCASAVFGVESCWWVR
jgi:hypothetical protein